MLQCLLDLVLYHKTHFTFLQSSKCFQLFYFSNIHFHQGMQFFYLNKFDQTSSHDLSQRYSFQVNRTCGHLNRSGCTHMIYCIYTHLLGVP